MVLMKGQIPDFRIVEVREDSFEELGASVLRIFKSNLCSEGESIAYVFPLPGTKNRPWKIIAG